MAIKVLEGVVVTSGKSLKTISVAVSRLVKHPKYHKFLKRRTIYMVHDEEMIIPKPGEKVLIAERKPISKLKSWALVSNSNHGEAV